MLSVSFSKNVFVFWYLNTITNFKFRVFFVRIFIIFNIRIRCNVNWFHFYCSISCVMMMSCIYIYNTWSHDEGSTQPVTWHRTPPLIAHSLIYYADKVNRVAIAYWAEPGVNCQFWVLNCPFKGCGSLLSFRNWELLPTPNLLPHDFIDFERSYP